MSSDTALVIVAKNFSTMPAYLNKAAQLKDDPVERLKMVICCDLASFTYN